MDSTTRRRRRQSHTALVLSYLLYTDTHGEYACAFAPMRPYTISHTLSRSSFVRDSIPSQRSQRSYRTIMHLSSSSTKRDNTVSNASSNRRSSSHHDESLPSKKKMEFSLLPDFMQKDPTLLTDKRILQQKLDAMKEAEFSSTSNTSNMEMMAMSAVSVALAVSVVYSLASSTPDMAFDAMSTDLGLDGSESEIKELILDRSEKGLEINRLGLATRTVVQQVLPQNADDVIAVSIGEGIAGAIGAIATWLLGMIFNKFRGGGEIDTFLELSEIEREKAMINGLMASEAVADGDYFLTRAAAQPLFEAAGLPIFIASLASVLVATVPYEAVKLSAQKQMEQEKEQKLLQILLQEEELRQKNFNLVDKFSIGMAEFFDGLNVRAQYDDDNDDAFEAFELMEVQKQRLQEVKDSAPKIDYVELFADLTKWLEYDVLINNYRGILAFPNGQMLGPTWESAVFGLMVALSSQLYTDVLYIYSDFGNPEKREKTLNRPLELWASIYSTKCLSAAALFGTYEALRRPISRFCGQVISGGYLGCVGSEDFDLCIESYTVENGTEASFVAVFNAFIASIMNWFDEFMEVLSRESLISCARETIHSLSTAFG